MGLGVKPMAVLPEEQVTVILTGATAPIVLAFYRSMKMFARNQKSSYSAAIRALAFKQL
ncbi:MAG: hypothetical protein ACRD2S_07760 [Terriglobales bacterium]